MREHKGLEGVFTAVKYGKLIVLRGDRLQLPIARLPLRGNRYSVMEYTSKPDGSGINTGYMEVGELEFDSVLMEEFSGWVPSGEGTLPDLLNNKRSLLISSGVLEWSASDPASLLRLNYRGSTVGHLWIVSKRRRRDERVGYSMPREGVGV